MRKVSVQDAVGMTLCHDITKVAPGVYKGRAFARGHVIREEDIEPLLNLGKENIYVWEENAGEIHEDDAAVRLAQAIKGENVTYTQPEEGKSVLKTTIKGLLKVNSPLLFEVNCVEHVTIPSIPNNYMVEKDQKIATVRIVPLVTDEKNVIKVEELCQEKGAIFQIKPYQKLRVGVVITGNEVFKGRVEDKFGPVIKEKMAYYDGEIIGIEYCPDELKYIEEKILGFKEKKADLILVTGGMSVDPDDLTPGAIKKTGAKIVTYGVPVQPGNMFLLAYLDGTPILGLPGAVMYFKTTVFDLVVSRVFAGEVLTKEDFIKMGEGGLCMNCKVCHYPVCYLGR